MMKESLLALMREVRKGKLTPEAAQKRLGWLPFEDMGFARLDTHRELRTAVPEVVFCQGKTLDQSEAILRKLVSRHGRALGTRAAPELAERFNGGRLPASYDALSRTLVLGRNRAKPRGLVVVLCAGTGDIPVAEEAARTAEFAGARVKRSFDVGVAGLHRLMANRPLISRADALVVAAGMEGALPSVVGGLARCPVVAVPTSVGYGASFGGMAALLAMMNSCAPGVAVVNIDNGFGAGFLGAMIARRGKR
jgi:pyridinium-3,5-biscarboxylic acid mononucleotide synthase